MVSYPTLVLILVNRPKGTVVFYPEAAVKAKLQFPEIPGKLVVDRESGYCSHVRLEVAPEAQQELLDLARTLQGIRDAGNGTYTVYNLEDA